MEIKKEELLEIPAANIYKRYQRMINKIYKDYSYADIDEDKFYRITITEIEKSKENFVNNSTYADYLKEMIQNRLIVIIRKRINKDDKMIELINNYIDINFGKFKTDDYLVYYLTKIDELFTSLNYIPNPDVIIELLNNQKLNKVLELYYKHNLTSKKSFSNGTMLLIDTYKELYSPDINIKDDEFDTKKLEVDEDIVRSYFNEIKHIPPLTLNEQKEYGLRLLNGDEEAREILIKHNLKLVVTIAKKYASSGISLIDRIQDGNEGLIVATERYDVRKGCVFNTYAAWWIRHRILRAIQENRNTIRIPYYGASKVSKYYQTYNRLRNELNREPTDTEIASELNTTVKAIEDLKVYMVGTISLDAEYGDEESLSSIIPYDDEPLDEKVISATLPKELQNLFKKCNLTDREIIVLSLRYGLDGNNPRTLQELGNLFKGISRERIRQNEYKALKKIRTSEHIEEFAAYMSHPDEAMERIKLYRKKYEESKINTYKADLLGDDRGFVYNNIVNETRSRKLVK